MDLDFYYKNRHHFRRFQLYVSNLPILTDLFELRSIFQKWVNVKLVNMRRPSKFSASASVDFYTFEQMMRALENSNSADINGMIIRVQPSKEAITICNYCYEIGHWRQDCLQIIEKEQSKLVTCFKCRRIGHIQKNCRMNDGRKRSQSKKHKMKQFSELEKQFQSYVVRKASNFCQKQEYGKSLDDLEYTFYRQNSRFEEKAEEQVRFVSIISSRKQPQLKQICAQQQQKIFFLWRSHFFDGFSDKDGKIVRLR